VKKLSKKEFDKKCLCGHAKSSHAKDGMPACHYCESCEFYEAQAIDHAIQADKEVER